MGEGDADDLDLVRWHKNAIIWASILSDEIWLKADTSTSEIQNNSKSLFKNSISYIGS